MKNILHGNGSLGRKMQSLFLMTLFVLQSTLSLAQNRTVTGVVVDEKDEPIIGANVTVKGTSKGTITDLDGKFVISAPRMPNFWKYLLSGTTPRLLQSPVKLSKSS